MLAKGQALVGALFHRLTAVSCAIALVAMGPLRLASMGAFLHRLAGIL